MRCLEFGECCLLHLLLVMLDLVLLVVDKLLVESLNLVVDLLVRGEGRLGG